MIVRSVDGRLTDAAPAAGGVGSAILAGMIRDTQLERRGVGKMKARDLKYTAAFQELPQPEQLWSHCSFASTFRRHRRKKMMLRWAAIREPIRQ